MSYTRSPQPATKCRSYFIHVMQSNFKIVFRCRLFFIIIHAASHFTDHYVYHCFLMNMDFFPQLNSTRQRSKCWVAPFELLLPNTHISHCILLRNSTWRWVGWQVNAMAYWYGCVCVGVFATRVYATTPIATHRHVNVWPPSSTPHTHLFWFEHKVSWIIYSDSIHSMWLVYVKHPLLVLCLCDKPVAACVAWYYIGRSRRTHCLPARRRVHCDLTFGKIWKQKQSLRTWCSVSVTRSTRTKHEPSPIPKSVNTEGDNLLINRIASPNIVEYSTFTGAACQIFDGRETQRNHTIIIHWDDNDDDDDTVIMVLKYLLLTHRNGK